MRFPLRAKFFLFAALLATAPLALVGQNLVRIARDELKSAANEDLARVAGDLAAAFDTTVQGRWMTPLRVIRNGVDSPALGVEQKISLLTLGLSQIPNIAALQLSVEGSDLPILVTDEAFSQHLSAAGLDPVDTLRTPPAEIEAIRRDGRYGELIPARVAETLSRLPPATPIEVWFQDEMRVGQKNGLVYQWAKKGTRPRQPKDQRYENAICSAQSVRAGIPGSPSSCPTPTPKPCRNTSTRLVVRSRPARMR